MNRLPEEFRFQDVVGVTYVEDHVMTVRFDDGFERTIDFEPILLGPLFGPLRDLRLFRQARIDPDIGAIVWPTGADIDPGVLYDWPEHVDAIVRRRRARWLAPEAVVEVE